MNSPSFTDEIIQAILELDAESLGQSINNARAQNADISILINEGLTVGLRRLGDRFEKGQIFLPELMKGARIVQENMEVLSVNIGKDAIQSRGKLLLGTVSGDLHDVGKNIVGTIFQSAGYEVIDLGIDVPADVFVEKVREEKPELLGLSALLTTTVSSQGKVIEALDAAGLRDAVKIIIGGAPVSSKWAEQINADAYAEDAFSGLRKAEDLIG
ncbi:MAG: corrinoid protein [Deltaproteobacteria bacterium]|nr:corrinoid protein [Deltaproteobacteria bacterium]